MFAVVKIGYWKGSLKSLRSRYATYYGCNDIEIFYVETFHPHELEKETHTHFSEYNISNELFKKKHIEQYIKFINQNKISTLDGYSINVNQRCELIHC